jgi:glucose-6-phosphate 1-dehydrogenase
MAGDATLFAREDSVEEAWRIVDPGLRAPTPIREYEPNSWGPSEIEQRVSPAARWQNPAVTG